MRKIVILFTLLLLLLCQSAVAMSEIPAEINMQGKQYLIKEMYLGSAPQGSVISQYFSMADEIVLVKTDCDSIAFEQTGEKDLVVSIDTMPYDSRQKLPIYIETTTAVYRYDLIFDIEEVSFDL